MRSVERLAAARTILVGLPDSAVSAARVAARRLGIDACAAYPLRSSFSVYVHLAPSPLVARVAMFTPLLRTPIEAWLGRELAVAAALDALGVPVVRPADPHVHSANGLHMSMWELIEPEPDAVPTAAQAGRLLGELHAAMREIPNELAAQRLPVYDDLAAADTPAEEVLALEKAMPARPLQVLHGDAHSHNLMLTARGWVWHDLEETCVGPVEWDLATLSRSRGIDGRAALRQYPGAPSYPALKPWVDLRGRQVVLWEQLYAAVADGLDRA